jgi:2-oxoglutarate ferredoxin oxidoreductase subunit gamma
VAKYEILMAGFGGQGVLSMGTLLAYAGMLEGKQVSWIPAYGPEQRGGTANCSVVLSDKPVASPIVTEPAYLVIMNRPSLDKFENKVLPGGTIFVNTSMVDKRVQRNDVNIVEVPANKVATELGSDRVANMVVLGAFIAETKAVGLESVVESLKKALPARRHNLIPLNEEALKRGAEFARTARRPG